MTRPHMQTEAIPEQTDTAQQAVPGLSALEVEVIGLFVNAVKAIGLPRSVGEIYGLMFISPEPQALDTLVERLKISKGSASQGLKTLRAFGAVRQVYVAGDRRDHYEAETELKKIASGFIREELKPHLESGSTRIARLDTLLADTAPGEAKEFHDSRIRKLAQWHQRSKEVLPLLAGMLD